jgi:hypothetical protein
MPWICEIAEMPASAASGAVPDGSLSLEFLGTGTGPDLPTGAATEKGSRVALRHGE